MKKVLLLVFLLGIITINGQDNFDEWLAEQNRNFNDWKSQKDKDFTEFLEKGWDNYGTETAIVRDSIPKPLEIPNPVDQVPPDLLAGEKVIIEKEYLTQPEVADIIQDISRNQLLYAVSSGSETLRVNFWGVNVPLSYNKNMLIGNCEKYESSDIADFWGKISNTDYEIMLEDLGKARAQFNLNDWGYCQLSYKVGMELYKTEDMANLFCWFVLTKSGYDSKVGYDAEHVYLLLATKTSIFGEPHLVLDEKDYYCISLGDVGYQPVNLYTYGESYPDADDLIDMNLETSPFLEEVIVERILSFSYKDNTWSFPVKQNKTLIEFLGAYPSTDLDVYFLAELSPLARQSLVEGLSPILEGKTEMAALNILLRFVQTAFPYQTDEQQFGSENSLFPEETLYYDYCDCEDRSFLFSILVEEFLALKVIGLDYPGHIATAVELKYEVEGDTISYDGIDYLVCDPTYINADIGVVMPQFIDVEPDVIQFR